MNVNNSWPAVESTNQSILGDGKLSLRQAWLRSVNSTHMRHFPLDFLTMTTLASHSG